MLRLFKKQIQKAEDEELLQQFRRNHDQAALAELFTRYTHLMYGVCMKYLKNPDDASDAVMSIYEKLEDELHRHEIQRFSTWLYVITKNHCLMELRSRQSKEKNREKWQVEALTFMESEDFVHPLDDDDYQQQQNQLAKCLEQLKTEQKQCVHLFYYENRCYLEISQLLKMEEKSVKSHLQNAKRNLKICMENSDEN